MDMTACGLPLESSTDIVQPLAAVICVKGLDADGGIAYWSAVSQDLKLTEAQGMALGLLDEIRDRRRES